MSKQPWEKGGPSPNPTGRGKGIKGKLSNERLAEELSKRTKKCIDTVFDLVKNSNNPNVKLKAALALLVEDAKARDRALKDVQDKIKIQREKIQLELDREKLKKAKQEDGPDTRPKPRNPVMSVV